MSLVTFKVKHYDKSVSKHVFNKDKGKKLAQMVGSRMMEDVVAGAAPRLARKAKFATIVQNKRVVMETAIYFQRVVNRTPKDEKYYNPKTKKYHYPDKDFVWKAWTIRTIGGRRVGITAGELGESLFEDFNDLSAISTISELIMKQLGEQYFVEEEGRKIRRLRIARVENTHARFPQLEYGTYIPPSGDIKDGPKYQHGRINGYSVQAPYGMERITRAEMADFTDSMLDKYMTYNGYNGKFQPEHDQVPTGAEMRDLQKIMMQNGILKRHLTKKDIQRISEVMDK